MSFGDGKKRLFEDFQENRNFFIIWPRPYHQSMMVKKKEKS